MPIHLIFANQLDSSCGGCSYCPIMLQSCLNLLHYSAKMLRLPNSASVGPAIANTFHLQALGSNPFA
jgi:hypothetical protein